jgi:hypothetical protein
VATGVADGVMAVVADEAIDRRDIQPLGVVPGTPTSV